MKCHICDAPLSQDEIKLTPEYGKGNFAPCGNCQSIIDEVFAEGDEDEGLGLAEYVEKNK
jgi:hypothetical protein